MLRACWSVHKIEASFYFGYVGKKQQLITRYKMVLEKVLAELSLPESLAKGIEEFAGIYRPPGYMKLLKSLYPMLDQAPKRWGPDGRHCLRGASAILCSNNWIFWRHDRLYTEITWYDFLKNKAKPGCPRLLWRHVRIKWD